MDDRCGFFLICLFMGGIVYGFSFVDLLGGRGSGWVEWLLFWGSSVWDDRGLDLLLIGVLGSVLCWVVLFFMVRRHADCVWEFCRFECAFVMNLWEISCVGEGRYSRML